MLERRHRRWFFCPNRKHEDEQSERKDDDAVPEEQDGKESEESQDEKEDDPWYATPAWSVEVKAGSLKEIFNIHKAIVDCTTLGQTCAASGPEEGETLPLRVELPGGASLAHFAKVLDFLYMPSWPNALLFQNLVDAVHTTRVAIALGLADNDVHLFCAALRGAVRTEEDLVRALQLFSDEAPPSELKLLEKRFLKQSIGKMPKVETEAIVEELQCVYTSQVKRIEIIDGQSNQAFFVHADVLERLGYLAAHQARWAGMGECPKVCLPDGASPAHFGQVLQHLRSPSLWVSFDNVRDAIQVNRVATMLSCDSKALGVWKAALRGALREDEDVALLRMLCEEEELPVEIQPVAQRATKRRRGDELSVDELRMMHSNAVAVGDRETSEYVAQHLKRRSRRGGAAMIEVKEALATMLDEAEEGADLLVIQFLKVHPEFLSHFMDKWNPDASQDSINIELLDLAFHHFRCDAISLDDMVKCIVRCIVPVLDIRDAIDTLLQQMATILFKLDAAAQLQVLEQAIPIKEMRCYRSSGMDELEDDAAKAVATFSKLLLIKSLCLEAKSLLVSRVVLLPDEEFVKLAKPPVLAAFGEELSLTICKRVLTLELELVPRLVSSKFLDAVGIAGARILVPVACAVRSHSRKQRILQSTQADISDDSEDGF